MSRRVLFTLIAVVIIGGGAFAAVHFMQDDEPVDAAGPTRIAASRPRSSTAGDGFHDVTGPSLTPAAEATPEAEKPTGPQMHPEVRAKVNDLQAHGIVPAAPPSVPSRARLTDVDWSDDPVVLEKARKGALDTLGKSPGDPSALRTLVMVSCATGNPSAAGQFMSGLPHPDQAMMATRCKAHGVDVPFAKTPDPAFHRPGANPAPPGTKTRPTPAPK